MEGGGGGVVDFTFKKDKSKGRDKRGGGKKGFAPGRGSGRGRGGLSRGGGGGRGRGGAGPVAHYRQKKLVIEFDEDSRRWVYPAAALLAHSTCAMLPPASS